MNGEIDPVDDQNYEIWNCTSFVIPISRGKSKLCTGICTEHSLLIINLHEQKAYEFVQFSELAINCNFCTPSLKPHPSIYMYEEIS